MKKLDEFRDKIYRDARGYYCIYLPDGKGGRRRKKSKDRSKIEAEIVSYLKSVGEFSEDDTLTVRQVFERYTAERLSNKFVSESTAARDRDFFNHHFSGVPMENRMFSGISATEWARWLQGQLPGLKQKQWSGLKSVVRGMLHYGQDYGLITFSADEVFSRVRIRKGQFAQAAGVELPETQVYTDDEMVVLKKYLRQNADQYNNCLLLIFATGMRIGEAVSLKADDILTDTMQVRVTRTETRYTQDGGKGKITQVKEKPKTAAGVRLVSVPETERELLETIRCQAEKQPWVFCRMDGTHWKRINASGIRKRLVRVCEKTGIPYRSPHKIRKTVASILLDAGVDGRFVKDNLGHTDLKTTEQSYHKNRRTAREKSKILASLPEFSE